MNKILGILKSDDIKKMIRFAITGIINTAVDLLVFTFFSSVIGFNIYASNFLGYSTGLLNSYIINRTWTFSSKEKFFSRELIKFITLGVAMLILSTGIIYVCSSVLMFSKITSKLITTLLVLVINFIISKLWVFK